MICNHRFLVLPGVNFGELASKRVADDWQACLSVRAAATCTHVGPWHDGYCCHCAGWTLAGRTGGRRGEAGRVQALALEKNRRRKLFEDKRRPVGSLTAAYDGVEGMDWAIQVRDAIGQSRRKRAPILVWDLERPCMASSAAVNSGPDERNQGLRWEGRRIQFHIGGLGFCRSLISRRLRRLR